MKNNYRFHSRIYKLLADRALGPIRRDLAARAAAVCAADGGPALDLGCGTGALLRDLAAAGANSVGLDNSPHMLRLISKRRPPFAVLAGSAEAAPFPDETFSAITMSMLLHESDAPPENILAEAARLLKPASGRLLILDWKLAERNLDYLFRPLMHGIELLMGPRHYRNFLAFMRRGGLEGVIQRHNLSAEASGAPTLRITGRVFLGLGTLVLLELRKEAPQRA